MYFPNYSNYSSYPSNPLNPTNPNIFVNISNVGIDPASIDSTVDINELNKLVGLDRFKILKIQVNELISTIVGLKQKLSQSADLKEVKKFEFIANLENSHRFFSEVERTLMDFTQLNFFDCYKILDLYKSIHKEYSNIKILERKLIDFQPHVDSWGYDLSNLELMYQKKFKFLNQNFDFGYQFLYSGVKDYFLSQAPIPQEAQRILQLQCLLYVVNLDAQSIKFTKFNTKPQIILSYLKQKILISSLKERADNSMIVNANYIKLNKSLAGLCECYKNDQFELYANLTALEMAEGHFEQACQLMTGEYLLLATMLWNDLKKKIQQKKILAHLNCSDTQMAMANPVEIERQRTAVNQISMEIFTPIPTPVQSLYVQGPDIAESWEEKFSFEKKAFLEAVDRTWVSKGLCHQFFIDSLIHSEGVWKFSTTEDKKFVPLWAPILNYIGNTPKDQRQALQYVNWMKNFVEKFNIQLEQSNLLTLPNVNQSPSEISLFKFLKKVTNSSRQNSQGQPKRQGQPLSPSLAREVAEEFFKIKSKWIFFNSLNVGAINTLKRPSRAIPCYLLSSDNSHLKMSFMIAHFDDCNSLIELSADSEGFAKKYIESSLQKKLSSNDIESTELSIQEVDMLSDLLKSQKQDFPFLILHKSDPKVHARGKNESQNKVSQVGINNLNSKQLNAQSEKKRKSISCPEIVAERRFKRARTNVPIPLIDITNHPQNLPHAASAKRPAIFIDLDPSEVSMEIEKSSGGVTTELPIATKMNPKSPLDLIDLTEEELSQDTFWQHLSMDCLKEVQTSRRVARSNVLSDTPLDYPIIQKLKSIYSPPESFPFYHPTLKNYQKAELKKLINFAQNGVSTLLSFEPGLGKTHVYSEYMAQMIARKDKINLLILPKSILTSIAHDLTNFFILVRAQAWILKWHKCDTQEKNDLFAISYFKMMGNLIETKKYKELPSLLPLLAKIDLKADKAYNALFDLGFYDFDINYTDTLNQHFATLSESFQSDPIRLIEFEERINELRNNSVCHLKNFPEVIRKRWQQCLDSNMPLEKLLSRDTFKDINFNHPFIYAQLMLVSQLLNIKTSEQDFQIYDEQKLDKLIAFSSNQIVSCAKGKDLSNCLKDFNQEKRSTIILTTFNSAQTLKTEQTSEYSFGSVILDEAQIVHTHDSKFHNWFKSFIKSIGAGQQSNDSPNILLVTGTPFENNLTEMWNLLALANPGQFKSTTHTDLMDLDGHVRKKLVNAVELNQKLNVQELVAAFAHFEVLRKEIVLPLVPRLNMHNPQVIKDWNNRIPKRLNKQIIVTMTPENIQAIQKIDKSFQDCKIKFFEYNHKVKFALLAPDITAGAFDDKNSLVKAKLAILDSGTFEQKDSVVQNSPLLNNLLSAKSFRNAVTKQKNVIIIIEHLVVGQFLMKAIQHRFEKNSPEIKLFDGSLKSEMRQKHIEWFQHQPAIPTAAKIFILMQKAAGVGLNLPQANKVFVVAKAYNPSVEEQAIDRAFRIGHPGTRKVYFLSYGIFFEHHQNAVQQKKREWEKFFWNAGDQSLRGQFFNWCNLQLQQCHLFYLNDLKNVELAKEKSEMLVKILEGVIPACSEELLQNAYAKVAPKVTLTPNANLESSKIKAPVIVADQLPALDTVPQPAVSIERVLVAAPANLPELKENDYIIIPLSTSLSWDEMLKSALTLFEGAGQLVPQLATTLMKNPLLRENVRKNSIGPDLAAGYAKWEKETQIMDIQKLNDYRVEIYEFSASSNSYKCNKCIDGHKTKKIRLYMKRYSDKSTPHFDVLVAKPR